MTQPSLNEKQLAELTEILALARIAEQKTKDLCEFAEALEEKWKRRLENRRGAKQQVGETE